MLPSSRFCSQLSHKLQKNSFVNALCRAFRTSSINSELQKEPEYLKYTKPLVPVYEKLNVQFKGYDYTVLEHCAKHVHRTALNMNIEVSDAWATPHQAWKVTNVEPNTTKVRKEFFLNCYERNIQLINLHAYAAPLFFDVIQSFLPEGVSVSIHPHDEEHEKIRYIPDFELIELKKKLEDTIIEYDLKHEI